MPDRLGVPSAPARPVPPRRAPLLPDQHGAWAFLALPVALAAPVLTWHPVLAPLVVAWVAAHPAAWALTGRLAAPRPERFDRALRTWVPVVLVAGGVALAWRPWLAWVALLYAAGFLVSLRYAKARRERALGNDLVLIAQCAAVVPVLVGAGVRGGWSAPLGTLGATPYLLAGVCALALLGSTLHVKSLIRERKRPGFARASRAYALACLLLALGAAARGAWWPLVPAAVAALRSLLVTDPALRPGRIGMVELAVLVSLAVAAWWV